MTKSRLRPVLDRLGRLSVPSFCSNATPSLPVNYIKRLSLDYAAQNTAATYGFSRLSTTTRETPIQVEHYCQRNPPRIGKSSCCYRPRCGGQTQRYNPSQKLDYTWTASQRQPHKWSGVSSTWFALRFASQQRFVKLVGREKGFLHVLAYPHRSRALCLVNLGLSQVQTLTAIPLSGFYRRRDLGKVVGAVSVSQTRHDLCNSEISLMYRSGKDHISSPLRITSASFCSTPDLKKCLLPLSVRGSENKLIGTIK
ncbi:hypothetical protein C8R47DRAFT_683474 [Mycena vitilis]|nr:hypothetical protein C8R47DRAFT_683474 [Mycena vitilis]